MYWTKLLVIIGVTFVGGFIVGGGLQFNDEKGHVGEILVDFEKVRETDLKSYFNASDEKAKHEKANEILAKILKLFLADLGLRLNNPNACLLPAIHEPQAEPYQPAISAFEGESSELPSEQTPPISSQKSKNGVPSIFPDAKDEKPRPSRSASISQEKAKGAVYALYQAILWRPPDQGGGQEATKRMTADGWSTYIENAKNMVQSPEFLKDIEPVRSPKDIINRMYSVFLGRCARISDLNRHFETLEKDGPPTIVSDVISEARQHNPEEIFEGGFDPSSCEQI